jgi:hypothetical protein
VKPEQYLALRAALVERGHGEEIEWAQTVAPPSDVLGLFFEYGWVVVNSGMKNQVAARIWERILGALKGDGAVFDVFKHPGKARAIQRFWDERDERYASFRDANDVVEWCAAQPWIGQITKWHLAKNLGWDCAKPDRWLERVAAASGESVDALCRRLANASGDRIGTVDLVIWRACNLGLWAPARPGVPAHGEADR